MVDTLTWRDTAAPDQSAAVGFSRLSSDTMNKAFSGASDALGAFHAWQQGQAANALANNEANYPTAAAQQAAAASGALWQGVDRSNLTPQALAGVDARNSTLLDQAGKVSQNAVDAGSIQSKIAQAAAGVNNTNSSTNVNNTNAAQTQQQTALTGAAAADMKSGNDLAALVASQSGGDYNLALSNIEAHRGEVSANAYQNAITNLQQRIPAAAAGAASAPGAIGAAAGAQPLSGDGTVLTANQVATNVQNAQANGLIKGPECVDLTRGVAGITQPVSQWYKDPNTNATNAPVGTPLATFMNRDGTASNRYDGTNGTDGKNGISGNDTTHTLISAGNMKAWEQSDGHAPHLVQLYNDDSHGKIYNANKLFAINDSKGQPLGANNPLAQANPATASPQAMATQHTQLQSAAAGVANAAKLADAKVNNGGIASRYTQLQEDKTPQSDLIAAIKDPKSNNQFSSIDPDLITQGLDAVRAKAATMGVTGLSDATTMALLQQYGSFQKSGLLTPNSSGWSFGRNGVAIDSPNGLKADLAKMADPDQLAQQNARSAGIAKMTSDLSDAAAREQANYANWQDAHGKQQMHPGYVTTQADTQLANSRADVQARTAALAKLQSAAAPPGAGPSPLVEKNANPKAPPARGPTRAAAALANAIAPPAESSPMPGPDLPWRQ